MFQSKFQYIKLSDFRTLGVGRWLNDEVVNYFVEKWCTESGTTLGLNSFFAQKCLFVEGTCVPKGGVLTEADEVRVNRWCHRTAVGVYAAGIHTLIRFLVDCAGSQELGQCFHPCQRKSDSLVFCTNRFPPEENRHL
jgi:hypothetical protein